MKISSGRLRSIISEEITRVLSEQPDYFISKEPPKQIKPPGGAAKHRSRGGLKDVRPDEKRDVRRGMRAAGKRLAAHELEQHEREAESPIAILDDFLKKELYWVFDNPLNFLEEEDVSEEDYYSG